LRLGELVWFRRLVMALDEYFARTDTPMKGSPVGDLMVRVIEKNPGIDFEAARADAHDLLGQAAGRKNYRVSPVLSPGEKAESEAKTKARFQSIRQAA
jgi:hypothetical protein